MGTIADRLTELGIALPNPPAPQAVYVPALLSRGWCLTSGQLPLQDGQLVAVGKAGREVSLERARLAARLAALNAVSVAAQAAGGVDRLTRVIKLVGFVQSDEDFHDQPLVVNGASELLESIFGPAGRHARSAVGVNSLPLNAVVEVECIFEICQN